MPLPSPPFRLLFATGILLGGSALALAQTPGLLGTPGGLGTPGNPLNSAPAASATAANAAQPPQPPAELRGPLGPAGRNQRQPVRRQASFVREPPQNPRARTQRPVQGAVQPQLQRDLALQPRPLYDPSASTAGQAVPAAAAPPRRRPRPEDDPFAPLGIAVGSFILRPGVDAGAGFTDNANATPQAPVRSAFSRLGADLRIDSNWSVHQFGLRGRVERQDFQAANADPQTRIDLASTLRLDVTRDTVADFGLAYRRAPDTANTYLLPSITAGRPELETRTASAGVTQRFGRVAVTLRGQYDELRYGDTPLSNGTSIANSARDVDIATVTGRVGYEVVAGFAPFVETSLNQRAYRVPVDVSGLRQGSEGSVSRAGLAVDFGPKLRGEFALGYLVQNYVDPTVPVVDGVTFDGNLAWSVSPLTTVRLAARTGVLDAAQIGAAGGISRDATLIVEHALQRNLLLTGTLGYGVDDYAGIDRLDRRTTASLGTTWRLNRTVSLRAIASHQRTQSSAPGQSYSVNSVEAGVRVEY